jgi:hypothetical protein
MIPENIRNEISQRFGCTPKTYLVPGDNLWESTESDGVYWELPALTDDEKPSDVRYREIRRKIMTLLKEVQDDPRILPLSEEMKKLTSGIKTRKLNGYEFFSEYDLRRLDKFKGVRKEWWEFIAKYKGRGVCFYTCFRSYEPLGEKGSDILIAMPWDDQYDFLRIKRIQGNNHYVSTEDIIKKLMKLEQEFGLAVVYASHDSLDFILERPIEKEAIPRIRSRLFRLCPDAEDLTDQIRSGRVYLWWD